MFNLLNKVRAVPCAGCANNSSPNNAVANCPLRLSLDRPSKRLISFSVLIIRSVFLLVRGVYGLGGCAAVVGEKSLVADSLIIQPSHGPQQKVRRGCWLVFSAQAPSLPLRRGAQWRSGMAAIQSERSPLTVLFAPGLIESFSSASPAAAASPSVGAA